MVGFPSGFVHFNTATHASRLLLDEKQYIVSSFDTLSDGQGVKFTGQRISDGAYGVGTLGIDALLTFEVTPPNERTDQLVVFPTGK